MMFIDHRYEVLESLGSGNWANVYKVRDVRTDTIYTLKLFQFISSEELYKHFRAKDMHHITKIEHPNLNHVVDFGHVGDHIYFISDYFEGNTLNHFRFTKSKVNALYTIIIQICYALNALHTQNILHKDIKPENILYKTNGNNIDVKLIDYGFMRLDLNRDTQFVSGTLPYIAPEIYLGKAVGFSSDFYSLGVVIYRLITDSYPFSLDQINALRGGSQQYFIPIFPSELNPNVPLDLEKLCLKLLETNPENRFHSSEEIINYINRAIGKEFPFSNSWSLVNSLNYNSYTVREDITNSLLDNLPHVESGNGKIISLIGGEGLGKDNILSLFRYNILSGSYFIFDYNCTRTDHEAFFALIKEYLQSLSEEEIDQYQALKQVSEKLQSYLFNSAQAAKHLTQSKDELKADFEFAKSLLVELSKNKPIFFIIRNIQHVHHDTIDFLNYLSPEVLNNRIMVLLSCTDFNKIKQISHSVLVSIPMFSREESTAYIRKIMNTYAPEDFCSVIHIRSSGNPYFIREILIDLTLRSRITLDTHLHFPSQLNNYALPSRIVHSIYSRMSHITDANYSLLQKLSVVQTPISKELIVDVCKVRDIELYNLLNDSKYNEILEKREENYYFSFSEAKDRLFSECTPKLHSIVSLKVLKYYSSRIISDIQTCKGLVRNADIAGDTVSQRKYLLILCGLFTEDNHHEESFETISQVLLLDFQGGIDNKELAKDLMLFCDKVETTGNLNNSSVVYMNQRKIPDSFEKHFVIGSLRLLEQKNNLALKHFLRAENLASSENSLILIRLKLAAANMTSDPISTKKYLDIVAISVLQLGCKINYLDLLAQYHAARKQYDQAISIIEDFLILLPPILESDVMTSLALLHNHLAEYYSFQKNVLEADQHFGVALNIWNRFNIQRYMGLIHNNISDLYLKQGFTVQAEQHSRLGTKYGLEQNQVLVQARALLNQGEAKIKMGEFVEAESKLLEAKQLIHTANLKIPLDAIQRNLALAKSKIIGFGHYFHFIELNEPKLIEGQVREINPLVKTYFYYLSEMSNPKKLRRLIQKNAHINFHEINEQEFYHNILSLLEMSEHDYQTALQELKIAMQFAGEINNHYAMAVFSVLQVLCHYGLREYAKADELIEQARPGIQENQYRYWSMYLDLMSLKLDLMNQSIPLRNILRQTNQQLKTCSDFLYYQLVVDLWQVKIMILLEFNAESEAEEEFGKYKSYLDQITLDISEDDRHNYLHVNLYDLKSVKKFNLVPILSRKKDTRNKWNDLVFDIANVNSVQRVKFLIEKGITQVISPWQYKLMVYSDKIANFYNFQCYNCDPDELLPPEFSPYIEKSFQLESLVHFKFKSRNILIAPLQSGSKRIGFLVLSDNCELEFTIGELAIIRNIRSHLTALIIRTWDYMEITQRMAKMNELMHISHDLIRVLDMQELDRQIVSVAIEFTNSTRGFMIKKDEEGNNLFHVQMDHNNQLLSVAIGISKTALSICQTNNSTVITYNADMDSRFKKSISVQDYAIHTIFCCPISVDEMTVGYLYLDNYNDSTREMYLNEDLIALFMNQIALAIKNSRQYENVLQKSTELNAIEQLKDEFMSIVAHELNTPLTTLQGYIARLKRNLYSDDEERTNIIGKLETSVNRLTMSINDITTMNLYNLAKTLKKSQLNIAEIIDIVHNEVVILSRKRHLQIKVNIEKDMPSVFANWEALHRMIYNVVLNAVRYTEEFGNIVLGVRRSAFPQEKIENKATIVIYVKDNGVGIPQFRLKDVFRKFYELNDIYAHKSGVTEFRSSGLGLGLPIAKRIAELHGGDIVIKSKENEGTSVFMLIPIK